MAGNFGKETTMLSRILKFCFVTLKSRFDKKNYLDSTKNIKALKTVVLTLDIIRYLLVS